MIYTGLREYLQYEASKKRMEKQKAEKQYSWKFRKAGKSRKAEQERNRKTKKQKDNKEAKKQSSKEAEKQEAKKQKSRKSRKRQENAGNAE